MALTKEQIRDRVARKILKGYQEGVTFAQIVDAVQAMTPAQKLQIPTFVANGKPGLLGEFLYEAVLKHLETLAKSDADGLLTDDALDLAEIERVFF